MVNGLVSIRIKPVHLDNILPFFSLYAGNQNLPSPKYNLNTPIHRSNFTKNYSNYSEITQELFNSWDAKELPLKGLVLLTYIWSHIENSYKNATLRLKNAVCNRGN